MRRTLVILLATLVCSFLLEIAASENDKKIALLHYEAIRARQATHYDEAIDLCQHALLIEPANSAILFEMFLINAECNNHPEAFEYLQRAAAADPTNKYYNEYLMNYYEAFGKQEKAIETALKLIEQEPFDEEYIQRLAMLYSETKRYKEAYKQFETLEKINGFNPDLTLEKVKLLYQLHQDKKVEKELRKAINASPDDARFLVLLGNHYMVGKKPKKQKAQAAYQSAVSKNPKDDYAIKMLAINYLSTNDTARCDSLVYAAMSNNDIAATAKLEMFELLEPSGKIITPKIDKAFDIMLAQHADDAQMLTSAANYFLLKQDTAQAIKLMRQSLEADPHKIENWSNLMFLVGGNDITKYGTILDDALRFNPQEAYFLYIKALIFNSKKNYQSALETIDLALKYATNETKNTLSTYWGMRGDMLYLLDRKAEAFEAFDESIKNDPTNHLILNNYAYFLALMNKDLQKAEQMSSEALKIQPTNATYLDTYAWILYLRGEYTLALFYISRAVANADGQHSEIYDHYGDILLQKGDREKAVQAWKKAIELGAENPQTITEKITKHTK